jgi:hypothetical protein
MTQSELARALEDLAGSLEESVRLATTRVEHNRVTAHALAARRLALESRVLDLET